MHSHVAMHGRAIETEEDSVSSRGPGWTGIGTVEAYCILFKWSKGCVLAGPGARQKIFTHDREATHSWKIFKFAKLRIFVSGGDADSSASCGCDGAVGFNVSRSWCRHDADVAVAFDFLRWLRVERRVEDIITSSSLFCCCCKTIDI